MKKISSFILVTIVIMAMLLPGCGRSNFGVVINEDLNAEITAENAAADSEGSAGVLTVSEGEKVIIEPSLENGTIKVMLTSSESAVDIDADAEDLMAQGEPAFEKEISGSDTVECELAEGDYMVTAAVTEKATGTIIIRTEATKE